jgi:aspartate/methionine/tyrosine aminotransferase
MKPPVFKLEKFFEKYEFSAPYILCASDNESISLKELLAMADDESLALWNSLALGYTYVAGLPLLCKEIAKLYQNVDEKGVLTFAGAGEGIFTVMNVLIRPGDHVIVPHPCYQSLAAIPKELGAEISRVSMKERGGGWTFDVEELLKLIRPNTRLIIINFPHNPTSVDCDRATMEKIVSGAKSVGAYLFSDEVYRFSEQREDQSFAFAADLYDRAISLGVTSKAMGLAGLRVGWIATQDPEIVQKCLDFKCYLSLCNSGPSEILTLMALRAKEKILRRNLQIIRYNLDVLDRFFQKHSKVFAWKRPLAGTTAFVKLLLPISIEDFVDDLVTKEGVMLLPGSVYDMPGNYFRLGFGRKNMPAALERLERYLRRHLDRFE